MDSRFHAWQPSQINASADRPYCRGTASEKGFGNWHGQLHPETGWLEVRIDMFYPLYVWKDDNSAYGGSFPDLPGVHTAADELIDLPLMAQEAVWTMYDEDHKEIPAPSLIERWHGDARFQNGFWMMVDIKTVAGQAA